MVVRFPMWSCPLPALLARISLPSSLLGNFALAHDWGFHARK